MANLKNAQLHEIFDMWRYSAVPAERAAIAKFAHDMNASDQAQLAQIIMDDFKLGGGYLTAEILGALWPIGYAMQVAMYDEKTRIRTLKTLKEKFQTPS